MPRHGVSRRAAKREQGRMWPCGRPSETRALGASRWHLQKLSHTFEAEPGLIQTLDSVLMRGVPANLE